MNAKYHVGEEYKDKIWTVISVPWVASGTEIILLKGRQSGYATDGLTLIN